MPGPSSRPYVDVRIADKRRVTCRNPPAGGVRQVGVRCYQVTQL